MKTAALWLATISTALASDALSPRLYHLTIETSMPNLEDNLRYATTRETSCLGRKELATAFPVLNHVSLEGCRLVGEPAGALKYRLACDGGHGTTGEAMWEVSDHQLIGTLNVKLGGKNMTFYQRITAVPVGQCEETR